MSASGPSGPLVNEYFSSEDPDEMLQNETFHERLHCLLVFRDRNSAYRNFEILTCTYWEPALVFLSLCFKKHSYCTLNPLFTSS